MLEFEIEMIFKIWILNVEATHKNGAVPEQFGRFQVARYWWRHNETVNLETAYECEIEKYFQSL